MGRSLIAAATTYDDAFVAVENFLAGQPNTTAALHLDYIPFHACILVLANRQRLTNRQLLAYLQTRPTVRALIDTARGSQDEEESRAARRLTRFFEDPEDGVTQNFAINYAAQIVAQQGL